MSKTFIDRGLQSVSLIKNTIGVLPEEGPLRRLRHDIKVVISGLGIIVISLIQNLTGQLYISAVLFLIILLSGLGIRDILRRVIPLTFFFGFLLSLPGTLNIFVPGDVVIRLFSLRSEKQFWIYHIPQEIGFTSQGLLHGAVLTLRVFNATTSLFILLKTTSFEEVMLVLKRLRVPRIFVLTVMLSYRYVLLFAKVVEDFYLAKKARFLGRADRTIIENWIAGRIHFLFKKTRALALEVTFAMKARGAELEEPIDTKGLKRGSLFNHTRSYVEGSMLRLEDLYFSYDGRLPALQDISLEIKPFDRFAVIGANGSGKSTLLKIMAGLIQPLRGRVIFKGSVVTEESLSDKEFLRQFRSSVGYVFQDPDVQLFSATVYDELLYGPLQLGLPEKEAIERVEEVMELLQLRALKDRPPYTLSGGQKKKVAIGSVLTMNPEILLLDEPTSGLDPRSQCSLVELIVYLNSEAKKTIVIATHDLGLVDELQARVAVLSEEHRIERIDSAEDILADEQLLLKVNLIHEHLHYHGDWVHRHLHSHCLFHRHSHGR